MVADRGRKQPYYIRMKNGGLFAMAGIWESWRSQQGEPLESCTVITTKANTIVGRIHDRMPVILPRQSYGLWLAPTSDGSAFLEFMKPWDPFRMTAYPVSRMVNNVKNEGEGCIKRIDSA